MNFFLSLFLAITSSLIATTNLFELNNDTGEPILQSKDKSNYWKWINGEWEWVEGIPSEPILENAHLDIRSLDTRSVLNGANFYQIGHRGWLDQEQLGRATPNWLTIEEIIELFPSGFRSWGLYYNANYPHFELEGTEITDAGELNYYIIFSLHLDAPTANPHQLDLIVQYEYARYSLNKNSTYATYYDLNTQQRPAFYYHLDFQSPKQATVSMEDYLQNEHIPYESFADMISAKSKRIAVAMASKDTAAFDRWNLLQGAGINSAPYRNDSYAPPSQKLNAIMALYGRLHIAQLTGEDFDYEGELAKIEAFYAFTQGAPPPPKMRIIEGKPRSFSPFL